MLVLTRREGEEIVVDIPPHERAVRAVVRIASVRGERVRVALDAPLSVAINRAEVLVGVERVTPAPGPTG